MQFVALDVETTGTLYYTDHIVEMAAVRFFDGEEQDSFSTLVNPGVPIPKEASEVNGITDDMLEGKPKINEVLQQFSDFCGDHVLVAHNAKFDHQFLSLAMEKHYCKTPSGPLFDTFLMSKKLFPGLSNYRLSTLVDYLKINVSYFHRAKQDAWACGQVFNCILRAEKNENIDINKLSQLNGKKELKFPVLQASQLSFFDL